MNKEKVLEAIKEGKRVSHPNFSKEEWMKQSNIPDYYTFEDGIECPQTEFWHIRDTPSWEYDWFIYGDNKDE